MFFFLTGTPTNVLSVRLQSKFHQKILSVRFYSGTDGDTKTDEFLEKFQRGEGGGGGGSFSIQKFMLQILTFK